MKNKLVYLMVLLLCCGLTACNRLSNHKVAKQQLKIYVVKPETVHKRLYFTGIIQPLYESALTSPMDAIVESMHCHYGQNVQKGDVVMTLNSSELQKQYNDTLTDYLKSKDSFTIAQAKFAGTQDLWKAGLLAKNNYLSEKSSLDTTRIALMQATAKLTDMLDKMDDHPKLNLSTLTIAEFDKISQVLNARHNLIHLKAPVTGVLLYPPKSSDDKNDKLTVGVSVKAGQVIALVGDLNGLSVEIDIPEVDIDKVHVGMRAKVTSIALGKQILPGKLVAVNAQANTANSSALPSFSATVQVDKLTTAQRQLIKVGMSAAIAIKTDSVNQLLVPISAVRQEKGQSMVTVQAADGSLTTRAVATGSAQAGKVIIESGLQAGDKVVYG